MKKIVIIFLALVIGVNCFSQTKQPVKQKLNYLGNLIYLDENSDFLQNSFVLGWHWYSGYNSVEKLYMAKVVRLDHRSSPYPSGCRQGRRYWDHLHLNKVTVYLNIFLMIKEDH